MQLNPSQLDAHLAQGLQALYVLHGDEPLLVLEAADAVRTAARAAGFEDREVFVVGPGFKWGEVLAAADNFSLFGGKKLIDLRIPGGKPGRDGAEPLAQLAQQPPADALTLITLPELDWQVKKSAWFTALQQHGVALECNAPPPAQLPGWLAGRLRRQGQSAGNEALAFIAEHVEGNLLAAHQEILKLGLLHPAGELTLDEVRDAVLNVARYDVEDFRQALLAGDAARCSRLLDGLKAEGAPLPLLMWICGNEVRVLAAAREAVERGRPADAALQAAKVFGARQSAYRGALARLTAASLRTALQHAARIDRMVKGLTPGDVWDELLQLALRLAR